MTTLPGREYEIFLKAQRITDLAERARFLDGACGDDLRLRKEVENLLTQYEQDSSNRTPEEFFQESIETPISRLGAPTHETPIETNSSSVWSEKARDYAETLNSVPLPKLPPDRVLAGRYHILAAIGEGGMGSVYLADQTEPVKRQVAIKLIKFGLDSRAVLARFDAERQALAMMDHPNIARVFDGGTSQSGQPFFVMELVRGSPLTRYCDEHCLGVNERLRLFILICKAVQHAHQKGIIHRDLKPTNVMVTEIDGQPTPKVIDFGVAKAIDVNLTEMSQYESGSVVGTPAYMAPEQADPAGDVDTRADVYALGVILYELLVGSPPFETLDYRRQALLQILRVLRESQPPRPSKKLSSSHDQSGIAAKRKINPAKLASYLRGELDWVVMKAIEKDRNVRYESASDFAQDIQRYLSNEVIEARPPSTRYRIQKFIRRNRVQVIAASLILFTLLAGLIGTSIGFYVAEKRLEELKLANAATDDARKQAESNFKTVKDLAMELSLRISATETGAVDQRVSDAERRKVLVKAKAQFEAWLKDYPDDETLLNQTAKLNRYLAHVNRMLGDYPTAVAPSKVAMDILEKLHRQFPERWDYLDELVLTHVDHAGLEVQSGRLKDSTAILQRGKQHYEDFSGQQNDLAFHRAHGLMELQWASVASHLGRFEEVAAHASRATVHYQKLVGIPASQQHMTDSIFLMNSWSDLGDAYRELGQIPQSLAAHQQAMTLMKAMWTPGANRNIQHNSARVRRTRARTLALLPDKREEAEQELRAVIPLIEKLVNDNPHLHTYHGSLADTHLCLGEVLQMQGKLDAAIEEFTTSLIVSRHMIDRFANLTHSLQVRHEAFIALGKAQAAAGMMSDATINWTSARQITELAMRLYPHDYWHNQGYLEACCLAPKSKK